MSSEDALSSATDLSAAAALRSACQTTSAPASQSRAASKGQCFLTMLLNAMCLLARFENRVSLFAQLPSISSSPLFESKHSSNAPCPGLTSAHSVAADELQARKICGFNRMSSDSLDSAPISASKQAWDNTSGTARKHSCTLPWPGSIVEQCAMTCERW